mgnify:FL=1
MSDWSSYGDDKQITDKWREFLAEAEKGELTEEELEEGIRDLASNVGGYLKRFGQSLGSGRTVELPDEDDDEVSGDTSEPSTTPSGTPSPSPAPSGASDSELVMPISGTELATMNQMVDGNILQILRKAVNVGAAAGDAESRELQKLFNKEFFTRFIKLTKNPNIDIAEGIDLDSFLLELLNEAYGAADAKRDPYSQSQVSYKKGQARKRGGMQRYLRSAAGKPPAIANKIARELTKALTKNVTVDRLEDVLAPVASTIKNDKEQTKYFNSYNKTFQKRPETRLKMYQQNVVAFVNSVTAVAAAAAAAALAAAPGTFSSDKYAAKAASRAGSSASATPDAGSGSGAGRRALDRMRSRDRSTPTMGGMKFEERDQKIYDAVLEAVEKFYNKRDK